MGPPTTKSEVQNVAVPSVLTTSLAQSSRWLSIFWSHIWRNNSFIIFLSARGTLWGHLGLFTNWDDFSRGMVVGKIVPQFSLHLQTVLIENTPSVPVSFQFFSHYLLMMLLLFYSCLFSRVPEYFILNSR